MFTSFTQHEADLYSTLKIQEEVFEDEPRLQEILDLLSKTGKHPDNQPHGATGLHAHPAGSSRRRPLAQTINSGGTARTGGCRRARSRPQHCGQAGRVAAGAGTGRGLLTLPTHKLAEVP